MSASRLNILLITSDQQHWKALGCLNPEIRTPHLDRLAREGALQSLVDLAPSFLSAAGLPVPRAMTGVDQSGVWFGDREKARDHVLVENRHEPTTIHLKTYVDERYKITVYYNRDYGELFDLREDPAEIHNL